MLCKLRTDLLDEAKLAQGTEGKEGAKTPTPA
jgi:hypothetical protein